MKIILRFIHDLTINYGYILLRFPPSNMHFLLFMALQTFPFAYLMSYPSIT